MDTATAQRDVRFMKVRRAAKALPNDGPARATSLSAG
jgi:hypothetical protein